MAIDWNAEARALHIVNVYERGNETGWFTPRVLYDPDVGHVFRQGVVDRWMDHGTVGTNTLMFWCTGGSISSGAYTMAHFLAPHEHTEYADGRVHDTSHHIFKMAPDGYSCNHTGMCASNFSNINTLGIEYESLQNGTADISERQLINGALVTTYYLALKRIRDAWRVAHGIVATPWGRRTDPWAGKFDIARSWEYVQQIRRDARVWQFWGIPQPAIL